MKHKEFLKWLIRHQACLEAIEWVIDNDYSFKEAWDNCDRVDWIKWLIERFNYENPDEFKKLFNVKNIEKELPNMKFKTDDYDWTNYPIRFTVTSR